MSFLDPYVVWDTNRTGGADPAYGYDGVAQAARRYLGAFGDYAFEAERLSDLGSGWVLAVVTESGRGRGSRGFQEFRHEEEAGESVSWDADL